MEQTMEPCEALRSILPYLPLEIRFSNLFWAAPVAEALTAMSLGPLHSRVNSGEALSTAISHVAHLPPYVLQGYKLFFDQLMSPPQSARWFAHVIPQMAQLLLRFPLLLQTQYQNSYAHSHALRLLPSQQAGAVLLPQELIGALLACSFFCLFPIADRYANHLPHINFDSLFASLYEAYDEKQEHKVRCIVHYFERICSHMPQGFVSFERKVLPLEINPPHISYPDADFWSRSCIPLCSFEVHTSGLIEDQPNGAFEVDFANKFLGGGALQRGCVQEEICFMINPELIAGMLFLPSMADNEAIEIVGAERFANYSGYASSFRFSGDYLDKRNVDFLGRRESRIVAIDALCRPGMKQYSINYLLRETNKAFCGFYDQSKLCQYKRLHQGCGLHSGPHDPDDKDLDSISRDNLANKAPTSMKMIGEEAANVLARTSGKKGCDLSDYASNIGIATGNWGCGAFGGDPEVKAIIQWLAASQALRPSISYYTFGLSTLRNLDQVSEWIVSQKWTVGDLWCMLVEYSAQRMKGGTKLGFLTWLLPSG